MIYVSNIKHTEMLLKSLMMFKFCYLKEVMNNNLTPPKGTNNRKVSQNEVDGLNNESIHKVDNRNSLDNPELLTVDTNTLLDQTQYKLWIA